MTLSVLRDLLFLFGLLSALPMCAYTAVYFQGRDWRDLAWAALYFAIMAAFVGAAFVVALAV